MSDSKNEMLVAAMVSIVAVVGMVVLFSSGSSTGNAVSMSGGPGEFKVPEQVICGWDYEQCPPSGVICHNRRTGDEWCGASGSWQQGNNPRFDARQ